MKNFLYKEWCLCLSPINFVFLSFAMMMLIPNYPCYVALFYLCLSVFFIFNNGEINKDMQYSLILPITKKDIVKSRCIVVLSYELLGLLLMVPFAILSKILMPMGNLAGIDGNVAFFGLAMIPLSVFHYVFFTNFYKKGERPGLPFLYGCIGFWLSYGILELPIWMKDIFSTKIFLMLDSTTPDAQLRQLPILVVGVIVYAVCWFFTYEKSAKNLERVDL